MGAYVFGPFRTWRDVQREDAFQKIRLSPSEASQKLSFAPRRPTISQLRIRLSEALFHLREAPRELRLRLSLAVFHRKSLMGLAGAGFYALLALLRNLS